MSGAREHNLRGITARFPVARLTCVTGVSGSGKSTLVEDTLFRATARALGDSGEGEPGAHDGLTGLTGIGRAALVDQSPIGKSSRSNPVTYLKAFDAYQRLWERLDAETASKVKSKNFERIFDAARLKVRAWEARQIRK